MQLHACRVRLKFSQLPRIIRSLSHFRVVDHVVPCSHTRIYPGATEFGHENELKLAVKQYIPLKNTVSHRENKSVTIIGDHANGFPKELYEPLWDDLYEALTKRGTNIRSIWIADVAHQGQSGIVNESILGNDANWWDHARDLLNLINLKQNDMPQPLIGIGHSVGAAHLAALSLLHPTLLQSLVLIEPVIQLENPSMTFAPASTYRRDLWPSRKEASQAFAKSKFYQAWDRRVFDKWIEYGLRDLPTEVYPNERLEEVVKENKIAENPADSQNAETRSTSSPDSPTPVTLTTTIVQEITQYLRPLYKLLSLPSSQSSSPSPSLQNYVYPDTNLNLPATTDQSSSSSSSSPFQFYRPEPIQIFNSLPNLHPSTHYIFGADSPVSTPSLRHQKLQTTGTNSNPNLSSSSSSSSNDHRRVKESLLQTSHMIPFELPSETAEIAAEWIDDEVDRYGKVREEWKRVWEAKSRRERVLIVDEEWKSRIPKPERPERKGKGNVMK